MVIQANQDVLATDYVSISAGAGDSGKAPILDSSGKLDRSFLPLVIETTAGATHSLTTVAGQAVIVWATGNVNGNSNDRTVTLKYNGVTKCQTVSDGVGLTGSDQQVPFALMYTEVPGAATANITVDAGAVNVFDVKIIVLKI